MTITVNPAETMYSIRLTAETSSGQQTTAQYDIDITSSQFNEFISNEIDAKTIVSISSSCIVLISGCIAVAFLLIYKKKASRYSRVQNYNRTNSISIDDNSNSRAPIRSDSTQAIVSIQTNEQQIVNIKKPSLVLLRGKNIENPLNDQSPIKGRLPQVQLSLIKQLSDSDIYNDDDEITPYATFRLNNFESEKKISDEIDEFKTFSVQIGEPPYHMIKECAATTSREYKKDESNFYSHQSITSGSSNQDELLRAYEFGRQLIEPFFVENNQDEEEEEFSSQQSDTPTDPGLELLIYSIL